MRLCERCARATRVRPVWHGLPGTVCASLHRVTLKQTARRTAKLVIGRTRSLRPRKPIAQLPRRLHVGAGAVRIPGWCNVDIDWRTMPDVVDNALTLRKFPNEHADAIYACHVLEHLCHDEVPAVLARWREVLKPGGELRISVPDLDRIVKIYNENWGHFQTDGNTPWIGLIYGGQSDPYDFHKTGFNFTHLRRLLLDAGFDDIAEYPHSPHFLGIEDASLADQPFNAYISLNVRATRR